MEVSSTSVERFLAQSISLERFQGKFTERARKALAFADEEASLLHHTYIGTEHLLLGLLRMSDGIAAKALKDLGIEITTIRSYVEQVVGRGKPEEATVAERIMTPRTVTVVLMSASEAWRVSYIGTEHLLLALLREGEGIGAAAIESLGIPIAQARISVFQTIVNQGVKADTSLKDEIQKRGNVVTCRIDSQDMDVIDALVEVGVRSTRSDAAAWLIHAGIEANQEMLESVYSTVAEIRALRTKAQTLAQLAMQKKTGSQGIPDPNKE